jgi:hypothetical protein
MAFSRPESEMPALGSLLGSPPLAFRERLGPLARAPPRWGVLEVVSLNELVVVAAAVAAGSALSSLARSARV